MPNKDLLYEVQGEQFGYNDDCHVTILYGFLDNQNIDIEKLQQYIVPTDKLDIKITGMSVFYQQQYDVLKFDVSSKLLNKMNKDISQNFNYANSYNEYIPHLTIAYVKKGQGDNFIRNIKMFYPKPLKYVYNYKNINKELIPMKLV